MTGTVSQYMISEYLSLIVQTDVVYMPNTIILFSPISGRLPERCMISNNNNLMTIHDIVQYN